MYREGLENIIPGSSCRRRLKTPSTGLGAKQSGINTKAGVAETPDQVEGRLAETKISRERAKTYTEKGSRVDDTVRIAKKQAAQLG